MRKKRKVVLASGTFDLLHLGHVMFLEEAKKAGGKDADLIVIVAETALCRGGKVQGLFYRKPASALVEFLKVVDEAILGYEEFDGARYSEN